VRERDHALADRQVAPPRAPAIADRGVGGESSPMTALDEQFVAIAEANPGLRVRVGNPDELRSNKLDRTLDAMKHRVHEPEPGVAESPTGAVITALNEEAVVCAALGNKGGLNLVVTYEAFAPKMLGAVRQELIFARHQAQAGRPPGWLGVPLVLTSHTWENAKNEQSHQDPTMAEALLGEMADISRVVFPPDANGAAVALAHALAQRGTITALVVPKRPVPHELTPEQAQTLAATGAVCLTGDPATVAILLVATGAYQLQEVRRAQARLSERNVAAAAVYLGEPGRFRAPRDPEEARARWTCRGCCSPTGAHGRTWSMRLRVSSASPVAACCPKRNWRRWMATAIRPPSCAPQRGRRCEATGWELALMVGTAQRGLQIAWAGLKVDVAVLRLRRRAADLLPAYVSTTLVGLGTTFLV